MKKITQNLTNVKAWQSTIFAFMFLFSLTINAQEVGDEFLANPGVNTTAIDAETGYDAAGTFNNNGNGNYGGWTAGTGGAYASETTANGDCHSPDRMFRLFKTGGSDGQFINQVVTALPAGNYNFGFWNKWDATSSNDEALPTWSADGDNEPKFTIKVQDEAGEWVTVHTHVPAEPTADMTWTEETGTWTNEETRDVRVMFYKNGGTGNAPSNLNNLWYIDTATLNYASALEATSGCELTVNMVDTFGDGWNGNVLDIYVNDVLVSGGNTIESGSTGTVTVSTNYGDSVLFDMVASGTYIGETEFTVTDASGATVASAADGADATFECIDPDAVNLAVSATTGVASATFSFDIANFTVGAAAGEGDGHIHWSIFASSDLENAIFSDMVYSTDDLTLTDLPDGDHTIVFSLVDPAHQPLDPPVEATVEFSTFDESYDCGDTQSYTYESGSGGGSGFATNFTGANEAELAFTVTPAAGENVTLVIGGETENNWDWIYVTDEAGAVVYGPATGPQDVTVTTTGAANVYVSADGSITKTLTFAITCEEAVDPTYALTFNLNTANIEVGENGMFVGGGFVDEILGGGANALPMTDEDGDGIWTATMQVPEGTSGNYTYINSTGNYDGKEDISGQECADADNWNDRVLDGPITEDTTLTHCYGFCGDSCPAESNLEFKGVIDFSVNQGAVNSDLFGGNDGKAVHVIATADIADMSIYSIVLYANGNTDPFNSFDFPAISASAGDEILVARNVDAQNYYMDASSFYTTIIDGDGWPTSNGNDALELYSGTEVIDVFGVVGDNPDTTGDGCATEDCWDHEDAWAYKVDGVWTYGDVNCTDGTETICESSCVYPFVETLCITTGIEPGCSDFEGDDGAAGWTIVEAAGNTSDWMLDTTPGAEDTQSMGHGYLPSDVAYNDWIVSPGYNTTGLAEPTLTYEEYLNWSGDAGEHNVYYSVDYDGDATTATWVLLNSEIGLDAEDVFTSRSFALPSDYNVVVGFQYLATYGADWNIDNVCIGEAPNEQINVYADPANAWGGYMDVFFLNDDGSQGDYAFGSGWDMADLQTTFNVGDASNIVLEPNFNTYNADDAYWSDGNGNGNKFMNATTQVESWDMYNGADLTFSGTVADNNLADGYEAVYFIKCLDPDAGYSDILAGAYVMSLPTSGEFSVSVSGDLLPEGKLVQFGFQVRGINANPDAGPYGRAVIGDAGLSVSDNTLLDMRIYPNPSNGSYVTIQTPVNGVKYVEVFDITGKRLMNTSLSADTLDVSSISAGLYLVKVTVEGQSKTSKLIIR